MVNNNVKCTKIKENRVPDGCYIILSLNKIDDPNSKGDCLLSIYIMLLLLCFFSSFFCIFENGRYCVIYQIAMDDRWVCCMVIIQLIALLFYIHFIFAEGRFSTAEIIILVLFVTIWGIVGICTI